MKFVTRADVTFYVSIAGGVLGIIGILWRWLVGRLVTKEELLKEFLSLREFLRKEFVSRREFDARMKQKK